jgi:hypothetical protein
MKLEYDSVPIVNPTYKKKNKKRKNPITILTNPTSSKKGKNMAKKKRSAKQLANDKRLGKMAKQRAAKNASGGSKKPRKNPTKKPVAGGKRRNPTSKNDIMAFLISAIVTLGGFVGVKMLSKLVMEQFPNLDPKLKIGVEAAATVAIKMFGGKVLPAKYVDPLAIGSAVATGMTAYNIFAPPALQQKVSGLMGLNPKIFAPVAGLPDMENVKRLIRGSGSTSQNASAFAKPTIPMAMAI